VNWVMMERNYVNAELLFPGHILTINNESETLLRRQTTEISYLAKISFLSLSFFFHFGHCLFVSHYYNCTLAFTLDTDIISSHKFVNKECNRVMQFPKKKEKFSTHHLLYRWDESEKINMIDVILCNSLWITTSSHFFVLLIRLKISYTRKKLILIMVNEIFNNFSTSLDK
jgi:hypothetical protein